MLGGLMSKKITSSFRTSTTRSTMTLNTYGASILPISSPYKTSSRTPPSRIGISSGEMKKDTSASSVRHSPTTTSISSPAPSPSSSFSARSRNGYQRTSPSWSLLTTVRLASPTISTSRSCWMLHGERLVSDDIASSYLR